MNNIKVFSLFELINNTDENDAKFLKEIKCIRDKCDALYVNFSYLAYENDRMDETNTIHYVTYPMEWLTHYIRCQFINVDPFFKLDYRLVSVVDWHDLTANSDVENLFVNFREFGLGNCGISLVTPLRDNRFGCLSLTFEMAKSDWVDFRKSNISKFKILSDFLSRKYDEIYNDRAIKKYNITTRERQCLYWVAKGKTDEQIAKILSIGKWTVVSHLKSAKYKLSCNNRASTIAKCVSLRLIELN